MNVGECYKDRAGDLMIVTAIRGVKVDYLKIKVNKQSAITVDDRPILNTSEQYRQRITAEEFLKQYKIACARQINLIGEIIC